MDEKEKMVDQLLKRMETIKKALENIADSMKLSRQMVEDGEMPAEYGLKWGEEAVRRLAADTDYASYRLLLLFTLGKDF